MGVAKEKKVLRKHISDLKSQTSAQQMANESREIIASIERLEVFKMARTVLAYWPIAGEVDLRDLLNRWQATKSFLLPVVKDDHLEIRRFEGETSLAKGPSYGILEPTSPAFQGLNQIDLVLVPGPIAPTNNQKG